MKILSFLNFVFPNLCIGLDFEFSILKVSLPHEDEKWTFLIKWE